MFYFPMNSIGSFLVAKKGIMLLRFMHMSVAYWFFGRGKCTVWHSNKSRKLLQAIISVLHLKSFRYATSRSSRPSQAYWPVARFTNAFNMGSIGFNRNDFPQFVGSAIRMFLFFCLRFKKRFLSVRAKKKTFVLLFCSTSFAHFSHSS